MVDVHLIGCNVVWDLLESKFKKSYFEKKFYTEETSDVLDSDGIFNSEPMLLTLCADTIDHYTSVGS